MALMSVVVIGKEQNNDMGVCIFQNKGQIVFTSDGILLILI